MSQEYHALGFRDAMAEIAMMFRAKGVQRSAARLVALLQTMEPSNPHIKVARMRLNREFGPLLGLRAIGKQTEVAKSCHFPLDFRSGAVILVLCGRRAAD